MLTSPLLDAVGDGTAVAAILRYQRWYTQTGTLDAMTIEISNDNGEIWTTLETIGPFGEVSGVWIHQCFDIDSHIERTDQMRVRFVVADEGDDSLIEAGVDGVQIVLVFCEEVLLGDVNLDGVVSLLDVQPFIGLLTSGGFQPEADINQDSMVDLLDVQPFVSLLTGN